MLFNISHPVYQVFLSNLILIICFKYSKWLVLFDPLIGPLQIRVDLGVMAKLQNWRVSIEYSLVSYQDTHWRGSGLIPLQRCDQDILLLLQLGWKYSSYSVKDLTTKKSCVHCQYAGIECWGYSLGTKKTVCVYPTLLNKQDDTR